MKQIYLLIVLLVFSSLAISQTCKELDSRFSVNGQEVTDTETGLIWKKCLLGKSGNDCSVGDYQNLTWGAALQAAEEEALITGKAWRLPNIKELRSIVDEMCTINITVFPRPARATRGGAGGVWSASPHVLPSNSAWHIDFTGGGRGRSAVRSDYGYQRKLSVMLVRTGQ